MIAPAKYESVRCLHCAGVGSVDRINPAWLRAYRLARGVSLREVARRTGCSAAFVSDVERGRRAWSDRLASGYGLRAPNSEAAP